MRKILRGTGRLALLAAVAVVAMPVVAAPPEQETLAPGQTDAWGPGLGDLAQKPAAMACTVAPAGAQDDSGFVAIPVQPSDEINVLANDASGVQLSWVGTPSHGTVEITGPGTVTYTVSSEGPLAFEDQFSYGVSGCLQCHNGWCSEPDFATATVHIDIQLLE